MNSQKMRSVFSRQKGVMVPGVLCVDRGNWNENATLLRARDCEESFWHIHIRLMRPSDIQRCRSLSERVGPRMTFLKGSQVSSCWKRSREVTTEPITVLTKMDSQWLHVATARRRCYYLERSKINHIAIKWTKYENVNGLVASHKIWWSPNF